MRETVGVRAGVRVGVTQHAPFTKSRPEVDPIIKTKRGNDRTFPS